ncbi:hypothetical protein FRB90_011790 [Tulasnella sp. 427]|nr:hypothetical protein FRB90_011790 [Tulasnella sp. 427]
MSKLAVATTDEDPNPESVDTEFAPDVGPSSHDWLSSRGSVQRTSLRNAKSRQSPFAASSPRLASAPRSTSRSSKGKTVFREPLPPPESRRQSESTFSAPISSSASPTSTEDRGRAPRPQLHRYSTGDVPSLQTSSPALPCPISSPSEIQTSGGLRLQYTEDIYRERKTGKNTLLDSAANPQGLSEFYLPDSPSLSWPSESTNAVDADLIGPYFTQPALGDPDIQINTTAVETTLAANTLGLDVGLRSREASTGSRSPRAKRSANASWDLTIPGSRKSRAKGP